MVATEESVATESGIRVDIEDSIATLLIDQLVVYPEAMRRNLERLGGLIHSQRILLALAQAGLPREDAYRLVQANAMKAWRGEGEFLALLRADPDVAQALPAGALEALFDVGYHLKHVDTLFARVFEES